MSTSRRPASFSALQRWWVSASVVLGILAIGFTLAQVLAERHRDGPSRTPAIRSGRQWQVVVIGSSTCPAAQSSELRSAIRQVLRAFEHDATAASESFASLGVALDWNPDSGIRWLATLDRFQEISAGANWLNQSSLRWMLREIPGRAATPQIVVVSRWISERGRSYDISPDSVVRRAVGVEEIVAFAKEIALAGEIPFP